jgi:solute carrier family 6 amino acid transporter-like protein 5/7/9/14
VSCLDTFTSFIAGLTIFGILGNLAYNMGETDISKVISSGGSGLAFISYPEAISKFQQVPQLFSVLFFFMLFVLGVGSGVALQGSIVTNILDHFPYGKIKYWQAAGVVSIIGFLLGLIYVTPVS